MVHIESWPQDVPEAFEMLLRCYRRRVTFGYAYIPLKISVMLYASCKELLQCLAVDIEFGIQSTP